MFKVLIVDDHFVVREGLKLLIELNDQFEVIGEAENGESAIEKVAQLKPDIILIDLYMPIMNGLDAIRIIKSNHDIPIIILTTYNEDNLLVEGIELGVNGYLLKDTDSEKLFHTMEAAVRGELLLQSDIMNRYKKAKVDQQQKENAINSLALSDKELVVLQAISKGYKSKAIAFDLGLTERTIKSRLTSIYNKLGVDSRAEAVKIGIQRGLIDIQ
ncbi:DNA-binding response regulator [Staphylococcus casei]|uniref:response regulator transcription factor n=1 Tax=Staphylococcus TaxID=1279 RepID=UPI000CD23014|nr:response regulator transcription factor [Staphylococcus casei]PNZ62779.1 DNA-binding response regulator [Staphylococcus casei]WJE86354.1 response regulator transcription factor [Staphylococcus casei]